VISSLMQIIQNHLLSIIPTPIKSNKLRKGSPKGEPFLSHKQT
jgi:hypothetical protein